MLRAHLSTCAAMVLLALPVGCGGDDKPARERPAAPTATNQAPAVPDGGLEQGHGVDNP